MFVDSAVSQILQYLAASFCVQSSVFVFQEEAEELLIIVFVDSKPSSAGVVIWPVVLVVRYWSE